MKIILVRHGQKQKSNSTDFDDRRSVLLTPKGILQIKNTAEYLSGKYPELKNSERIYSSQFPRAVQSAEIIRNELNISEIIPRKELNEYYAFNDYTKSDDYRSELQKKLMIDFDFVSPEVNKSMNDYISHTREFFEERSATGDETILCICHGGVTRHNVYDIAPDLRPSDEDIFDALIGEGSVTEINLVDANYTVNYFDRRVDSE